MRVGLLPTDELAAIFERGREDTRRDREAGLLPALTAEQTDLLVDLGCPFPRHELREAM